MFACTICNTNYSTLGNRRRHVKVFHSDKIEELAPFMKPRNNVNSQASSVPCTICNMNFSKRSNLNAHIKKYHAGDIVGPDIKKSADYMCEECGKKFLHPNNLVNHKRQHDPKANYLKEGSKKCPLCSYSNSFRSNLLLHFTNVHGIQTDSESFQFDTYIEFEVWKCKIENETRSLFVKEKAPRKNINSVLTKYVCHRSGMYIAQGNGIRHLKMQGTNKINGFCPAALNVLDENGIIKVTYSKTHLGHSCALGHLNLSIADKQDLASKIALKIPFPCILDDVRDAVRNCKLERLHLLTKKDLYNIEQRYHLNSNAVRHRSDAVSVEAWVNEMAKDQCVLCYKPQGTIEPNYPVLKKDDFILIIMTEGQKDMLIKYGNDCICLDGTHGLNSYGFELNTLLVIDDMREGFPCAFLISNRADQEVMTIFFSCVKKGVGFAIKPTVFMSDMAEVFFNAWIQVMERPYFRLYCTWHVYRAWRNNLHKIASKETQVSVYKILRTLLQETDVAAFSHMMEQFLTSSLSDPDLMEFAHYFQLNHANKVESWANCHRIGAGLNTNMHIERMHQTIKYIYLDGKQVKRLDKAINAILKFVRDTLFNRVIVSEKGKLCQKIKNLRERHKRSQNLDFNLVIETDMGWEVPSLASNEIYFVEERKQDCSCRLICSDCNVCLHQYSCSCLDSSIKWNMCKHIHLVCTFIKMFPSTDGNGSPGIADKPTSNNENIPHNDNRESINSESHILQFLSRPNSEVTSLTQLLAEKEKLKLMIDSVSTQEELEAVKLLMAPIQPVLAAIRNQKSVTPVLSDSSNIPHNKNIIAQRRFYSTKKIQQKRSKGMVMPSSSETANIAMELLNS